MKKCYGIKKKSKKFMPGRFLVVGFAVVILVGTCLLLLPISHNEGIALAPLDALFTATSSVCVTGLVTVDPGDTFSLFGRCVLALLIQIGGLGVTSIGVSFIMLSGKKITMRNRTLVRESLNYSSDNGVIVLLRNVILVTIAIESVGAVLSFIAFIQQYPLKEAIGYSLFHSVSAFNNAGFDVFGGFQSLSQYQDNVYLNLVTMALIICGGIGFFVICDVWKKRKFKKLTLHTKVVLTLTAILLVGGTLLIRAVTDISWLGAAFASTSARTAGMATFSLGDFSNAGLLVMILLMFVGASPGSTGGGIKTTTFFILIASTLAYIRNRDCVVYNRKISRDLMRKAFAITTLATSVVFYSSLLISVAEPQIDFIKILFEVVSGFSTSGLSTGITPSLSYFSKAVLILTMFIGRLGPFVMASIWFSHTGSHVSYVEENITVG